MKKKILAAAAVIIAVIICFCVFKGKEEQPEVPSSKEPITVNLEPETTKKPFFSPSLDKTVTVTLPIEFVDKKYKDDLEAFAEANGYYSIQKKGDTHVKIKMREYSYKLILTSIGMETVSGIGAAMDSGDFPFLLELAKYNSDFSEVVLTVSKKKYKKAKNKDDFFNTIAFYCLYYQNYSNSSEGKCKIIVCEKGTNILIEEREFDIKSLTK